MKYEDDVGFARKLFYEKPSKNLTLLLQNRYEWMNNYIDPHTGSGVEVGAGAGISKEFIKAKSFLLTDLTDHEWLDVKNVDSLKTPFANESFDFVVSSNMIHHLSHPIKFFEEINRILKMRSLNFLFATASSATKDNFIR